MLECNPLGEVGKKEEFSLLGEFSFQRKQYILRRRKEKRNENTKSKRWNHGE